METTRNPGLLALVAGVGLGVLFGLLGVTGALDAKVGLGLAAIAIFTGAFLYLVYMRGSAVAKTGYASLMLLLALGLIIPFLLVNQQQAQASEQSSQYDLTLHRGAALFGQYCAPCHGYQGKGKIGPQLNNNPVVNKLSDDDVTRIISGGVPYTDDLSKLMMPAWSQAYGGPLTEEDISYLLTLIRSTNPDYTKTKGLPNVNGFSYVLESLTNPTQIAQYHADESGSTKPPDSQFSDQTGKKTLTITAVNSPPSGGQWGWVLKGGTTGNLVVSVGTTITWENDSSAPHNVYSGPSGKPDGKFQSPIFSQGQTGFSFTFDKAGEYPYYCALHPFMIGWITVK